MRTNRMKVYGLRINCDKNGCEHRHEDHGHVIPIDGPKWQERWERATLNGHACDKVTQIVIYEPWLTEEES